MEYMDKEKTTIKDNGKKVPVDVGNRDYQDILKRVDNGEVVGDYVAPAEPEYEPTAMELLKELNSKAVMDTAKAAIRSKR